MNKIPTNSENLSSFMFDIEESKYENDENNDIEKRLREN